MQPSNLSTPRDDGWMILHYLSDDVLRVVLDQLGGPTAHAWTTVLQTCRDFRRIAMQRVTWTPYIIPKLHWTYSTGHALVKCTASSVVEVNSHEPSYYYRTFKLTPTSVVSQPHFECVRENSYVHIHKTWITSH